MLKIYATFLALVSLNACSGKEVLAKPTGPSFALNTGHWQPTASDLQLPKPGRAE